MPARSLERAADKLARICAEHRDLASLWTATTEVLADAVPFYGTPCYYTLDPASLLITSHFHHGLDHFPPSGWRRSTTTMTSTSSST